MAEGNRKPEMGEIDPAKIEQLLEIELMQKRAAWQHAKARRGGFRAMSFLFLFLIIVAALFTFFVFFSPERRSEMRAGENAAAPEETPH